MENQNDEVDLVNDLSEVLNELNHIDDISGGCDLWRTVAWNGDTDFTCMERCGGVTVQEAVKYAEGHGENTAWTKFQQRNIWLDPENKMCEEGFVKDHVNKVSASCDPSKNGCFMTKELQD